MRPPRFCAENKWQARLVWRKETFRNSCDNRPKSLLDAVRGWDVASARRDKDDCTWRSR